MLRAVVAVLALLPATAAHAAGECHVVDIDFQPAISPAPSDLRFDLQIVVWVETSAGQFVDTVFITRETGTFGLGNRPGRFDFNSGPHWPYGRRTAVFPVWSHKHGILYPLVLFQDGNDDGLSHSQTLSSVEEHYCAPKKRDQFTDAITCASVAYTDKGLVSGQTSNYPPRNDLVRTKPDDPSTDMYALLNALDAISGATPPSGVPAAISWPIPPTVATGDYVLWVEVSREFDYNGTYNATSFPSPSVAFGDYGVAYRGQPSVLYKVPFTLTTMDTTATTVDYAGYGDPEGNDGVVRPPDATITSDVDGSGSRRLALVNNAYRVRLLARSEEDVVAPGAPGAPVVTAVGGTSATVAFVAPGDDGTIGKVTGYDIRFRVGEDITDANFDSSPMLLADAPIDPPGTQTSVELAGLLPLTTYSVGIRAFDNCRNVGPLVITSFTTTERESGSVDACFIATAAYGSVMANDVTELRSFRDRVLRQSVFGELAVEAYYTVGPALAGAIGESDLLRATARGLLQPLVDAVRAPSRTSQARHR